MSDLPAREDVPLFHDAMGLSRQEVILAYKQGKLMTATEWRDTANYEAARKMVPGEVLSIEEIEAIVDAALRDNE